MSQKTPKATKKVEKPEVKAKTVIFVATYPDKLGRHHPYMDEIDKREELTMLHPSFNFNNDVGQRLLEELPEQNIPSSENHWENMMRKDFFSVKQAELMIYDLDIEPGHHFLAAAGIYHIPVIGVSEVFRSILPYFSGICVGVVKHAELLDYLGFVINHNRLLKSTKKPVKAKPKADPDKVQVIKETLDSAIKADNSGQLL